MTPVLASSAMVLALFFVSTVWSGTNLSPFLPMTVRVPVWPLDEKARFLVASYAAASGPAPIAGVSITLPVAVSTTTILLLSQAEKSSFDFAS